MTNEQRQEKKAFLLQTIDASDVLYMYGVKITRNRCRGFCHNGNDPDSVKVFRNGIQCFVCGARMDIFNIVRYFEHCDYMTAFNILGGSDEIDEKTKKIMAESKKKRDAEIEESRKRTEKIQTITSKINMYNWFFKQLKPMSDEWCYCKDRWFRWMYLFEYYTEKYAEEDKEKERKKNAKQRKGVRNVY